MSETVRVQLSDRSYDVRIGAGTLDGLSAQIRDVLGAEPERALLVTDTGIPGERVEHIANELCASGIDLARAEVTPSELEKSIQTYERLLSAAASARLERNDPVIALGGGIVGDLSGFVAASYRRGVPVIQCPTTLLSMVDASVGGKTGVNLPATLDGRQRLLKNFVGAFHQPRLVIADTNMLASLDPRVFRAGLGECVKHAMIAGSDDLLAWTETNADALLAHDADALESLVTRSVRLKAGVVAGDERETASTGGRALLNLGHTFAHAIETLDGVRPRGASEPGLQHGEAVAIGLVAAMASGEAMGVIEGDLSPRVIELLERLGLPTGADGLPSADDLMGAMLDDKKTSAGRLRLILPTGVGRAEVFEDPDPGVVRAGLAAIGAP